MPTIRLASSDPASSDPAAVVAIYAPACELPTSFELVAPTSGEMSARIEATARHYPWIVLDDGGVIGYAYASRHMERAAYAWSVNVSVYVAATHHRRGVGRALYQTLFEILAAQGFYKAYAGITLPNPSSTGLHETMGFGHVGVYRGVGYKLGAWRDVAWFERPLRSETASPGDILPVPDLNTAPWPQVIEAALSHYRPKD